MRMNTECETCFVICTDHETHQQTGPRTRFRKKKVTGAVTRLVFPRTQQSRFAVLHLRVYVDQSLRSAHQKVLAKNNPHGLDLQQIAAIILYTIEWRAAHGPSLGSMHHLCGLSVCLQRQGF